MSSTSARSSPSSLSSRGAAPDLTVRAYVSDDDLDREALLRQNLRRMLEQEGRPIEVAAILELTITEVEVEALRIGVTLPCPVCGAPRFLQDRKPPLPSRTCGSRSCVVALRNRARRGKPGPRPAPETRERIATSMRRYWAR